MLISTMFLCCKQIASWYIFPAAHTVLEPKWPIIKISVNLCDRTMSFTGVLKQHFFGQGTGNRATPTAMSPAWKA